MSALARALVASVAALVLSHPAAAQQAAADSAANPVSISLTVTPVPLEVADTAFAVYQNPAIGPTLQAARAGIDRPASRDPMADDGALRRRESPHLNQSQALMLAGGAGVLVGALIGGGGGDVLMLGGAAVALYGLYQWSQH